MDKDDEGNVVQGRNVQSYGNRNCIVNMPGDKIAVLQGLDGYIVVESNNTLLICRREDEQQIRQFVNDVQLKYGAQFV